ncbi:Hypothetical protein PMN2A_2097 [Prochlorococcus marinus str. NATL2A]|uniref:Uncharacterized protein n=1 Tax=Prochlorococcus marinus (strain NATL2A) TaxID=59920 RepID=A7MDT3_PROMT|nr:Hypothetical protein PMN2A_2097 [Prochlorococcus marinus str. NATL2A]
MIQLQERTGKTKNKKKTEPSHYRFLERPSSFMGCIIELATKRGMMMKILFL